MAADHTLTKLVGSIYDCILSPERWFGVLQRIQERLGAQSSYLLIHGTRPAAPDLTILIEHNVDAQSRQAYDLHYIKLNPLLPYLASIESGQTYCCRHLVTRPEYLQSAFYQEWAKLVHWFDYAGVTLIRRPDTSAAIGFTRVQRAGVFDDDGLRMFKLLAPRDISTGREKSTHENCAYLADVDLVRRAFPRVPFVMSQ